MARRLLPAPAALALLGGALCLALGPGDTPPAEPRRDLGLIERSQSRLAQLDITVIGSPTATASLVESDFDIRINFRRLEHFELDRLCSPAAKAPEPAGVDPRPPQAEVPPAPRASYLFYFDQSHLTMEGRQRAIELARELVTRLVHDGTRAMLVSNARSLSVLAPLSGEAAELLEALERLEGDRAQWDTYAQEEESRILRVVETLNDSEDISRAIGLARLFQKEERWRADRDLRRLEVALGQLAGIDSPKAVIYFADTMRANAGEHYLSFFGESLRRNDAILSRIRVDTSTGGLAFDRVLNEASSQGIRIYTVEARGLVSHLDSALPSPGALARAASVPPSGLRAAHAQRTLSGLAAETGGHAFLNGVRAARMAERILADSSCVYLVSFDPTGFRQDAPLRVSVSVKREDVELRVRGRLVLQSESARLTSRLLSAFGAAQGLVDPFEVRSGLVPTGFDGESYSALLQISVAGNPLTGSAWDLGASLVAGEKIRGRASGQVRVSRPGVPVVLESEVRFKPGPLEIVSVAHELQSGLIASDRQRLDWPVPDRAQATASPIALLQPVAGAFLRGAVSREAGSLARGAADPVRIDRPVALVTLVCRSRRHGGPLAVERSLTGDSRRDFDALRLELEHERCAQIRDLLAADSLRPGHYRYELRAVEGGRTLLLEEREFEALPAVAAEQSTPQAGD